jgi:hypothetical protein
LLILTRRSLKRILFTYNTFILSELCFLILSIN